MQIQMDTLYFVLQTLHITPTTITRLKVKKVTLKITSIHSSPWFFCILQAVNCSLQLKKKISSLDTNQILTEKKLPHPLQKRNQKDCSKITHNSYPHSPETSKSKCKRKIWSDIQCFSPSSLIQILINQLDLKTAK